MKRFILLLLCVALLIDPALAGVTYHGTTGQTIYVRVQTGANTFVGIQMTEGTSGGLGVYAALDSLIDDTVTTSSAAAGFANGYPFTIRSGTASNTANDTILGSGTLSWSGAVEIGEPANVTYFGGTAGTFASGRPAVNTTFLGGTAIETQAATNWHTLFYNDDIGGPMLSDLPTNSGLTGSLAPIKTKTDSLTFTVANKLDSNVYTWNGTAVATPDTAGYPKVTVKNGAGAGEIRATSGIVWSNMLQILHSGIPEVGGGGDIPTNFGTFFENGGMGAPTGALISDIGLIKGYLDTEIGAIKTKTDFLPSATAGASGGLFIAGTNAATTVTGSLTTTFTGNLTGSVGSVTGNVGGIAGDVNTFDELTDGAPTFADAMDDHGYTTVRAENLDNLDAPVSSGVLASTTIATLASQTSFTLTAGPPDNDVLNGALVVVTDAGDSTRKAVGIVKTYVGSSGTVTLIADPGIFTMAEDDRVDVIAVGLPMPLWLGQ